MEWIRVSAKTVEDAVTEATIQLGTSRDNIEYQIIEKGSTGFFGIGAKKATIEVRTKKSDEDLMKEVFGNADKEAAKEASREDSRGASKEVKKEAKKEYKEKKKETKDAGKEAKKEQKAQAKENVPAPAAEAKKDAPKEKAAETDLSDSKESVREKRESRREFQKSCQRNSRRGPKDTEKKPAAAERQEAEGAAAEPTPKTPRVPADPEVAKRRAETFLKDVFRVMEMQVELGISYEEDTLSVDITGDDMGILIGKRGQTLDSLQYLTSLVVNKGNAAYVRVKLDTEDYRSRRKATLENLAKNIAVKVKKTRRPVFLEPMNPYERRIIHSALQNDPYVTTHSEGEEPCRKVVVTLRKNSERTDRRQK